MAEQQTGASQPTGEKETTPETGRPIDVRKADTRAATENIFRKLVPQYPTSDQLKNMDEDPVARKIHASEFFGNLTKNDIERLFPDGINFPDGTSDSTGEVTGNPVWVFVNGEKMHLASIPKEQPDDMDDSKTLICTVVSESGNSRITVPLSRQAIIEANLYSEREAIVAGFEDNSDEQAVVRAYLESINPDPDARVEDTIPSDEVIKNVAEQQKMLTLNEVTRVVDMIAQGNPAIQDTLKGYEGRIIVSDGELNDMLTVQGAYPKDDATRRIQELGARIDDYTELLAKDPPPADDVKEEMKKRKAEDEANLAALNKTVDRLSDSMTQQAADAVPDTPEGIDAQNDRVGAVIEAEMAKLRKRMEPFIENDNTETNLMRHLQQQYDLLTIALDARGEFGVITRKAILQGIATNGGGIGVQRIVTDSEFLAQHDAALEHAKDFAEKSGLSSMHQEELLNAFRNPELLPQFLLSNNETMRSAAEAAVKGIFGNEVSETQADAMFDAILDSNAAIYDATTRAKVKRFLTENKLKKACLLAIILAGVPVVLAGITAASLAESSVKSLR